MGVGCYSIRTKVCHCGPMIVSNLSEATDNYVGYIGTITDYIAMDRPERDEPAIGDPNYWRAFKTLPIAEFFESWEKNYLTLEWVTVPENDDDGAMLCHTKETDVSAKIAT
jgi:hypothetical protein